MASDLPSRLVRVIAAALFGLSLLLPLGARAAEWTSAPEPVLPELAAAPIPEGWETVHGPFLEVHGSPDDYGTLLRLARHGARSLPELADALGVPIGDTVRVFLAVSEAQFDEIQPGNPPVWADGTAYPVRGLVFLRSPDLRGGQADPLDQVLDHELVHVLLGRAFYPERAPQWLDEGFAQVASGEYGPRTTRELARGMLGRGLYSLEELSWGFPSEPRGAQLAYAQSADFISWLRVEYGDEALQEVVRELAAGKGIHAAVRTATGLYLEDVDRAWRSRIQRGSALWFSSLGAEDAMWFLTGVLGFFGVLLIHARQRRKRAAILEEELRQEALIDALRRGLPFAPFTAPQDGYSGQGPH